MPIYIYKCNICGKREEKLQKITERASYPCTCHSFYSNQIGLMIPQITPASPHFKGSGFYKTDYK